LEKSIAIGTHNSEPLDYLEQRLVAPAVKREAEEDWKAIAELFLPKNIPLPAGPNSEHNLNRIISATWDRGNLGGPTVKFPAAALVLHVMSRAQLRELMLLFVVSSALTLAVFFLALFLLPFETFTPFSFPRFPGFF
jgi:hypothetical protein